MVQKTGCRCFFKTRISGLGQKECCPPRIGFSEEKANSTKKPAAELCHAECPPDHRLSDHLGSQPDQGCFRQISNRWIGQDGLYPNCRSIYRYCRRVYPPLACKKYIPLIKLNTLNAADDQY